MRKALNPHCNYPLITPTDSVVLFLNFSDFGTTDFFRTNGAYFEKDIWQCCLWDDKNNAILLMQNSYNVIISYTKNSLLDEAVDNKEKKRNKSMDEF